MTPFSAPYSTSICGSCVGSTLPLFLLSAGIAILVLVAAHEIKPAWYSSLGSLPVDTLLIRVGASRRTPFCDVFRVSRVAQALSAWSWVSRIPGISFVFRMLASYSRAPTLALQSFTLSTWR